MRFRPLGTFAFALSILSITAARADTLDIRSADNAVWVDAGSSYLDYAEKQDGSKLNANTGWIPTAALGASILASDRAKPLLRNLFLRLEGQASMGSTAYDSTQCPASAICSPNSGTTDDRVYSLAFQMGRAFTVNSKVMLTPYVDVDYRHWNRDTLSSGAYTETFSNQAVLGGMLAQFSPVPRWVFSVAAAGGTTFGAGMDTQGETFRLGQNATWQVQGKVGYSLDNRIELTLGSGYQTLAYGASPDNAAGKQVSRGELGQTTVLVGVAYHLF